MSIIMVCLGDADTGVRAGPEGVVNLLTVLLNPELPFETKLEVLREYNVPINESLEGEVLGMGSFADVLVERYTKKGLEQGLEEGRREGLREGRTEGRRELVRNLMANAGVTLDRAMEMLGLPLEERHLYEGKSN